MPPLTVGGYTYDEVLRRYRGPGGRIVSRRAVRDAIDEALARTAARARDISLALRAGDVTLVEWEATMRVIVKDAHLMAAASVRGGWDRMTPGDYGRVGQIVRGQYEFLERFAAEISSRRQDLNEFFINRAEMYAEAGRQTHEAFTRSDAIKEAIERGGELWVRNVLGDAVHCDTCLDITAWGWVRDDGTMPLPGMRKCLTRCKCHLEREIRFGDPPLTLPQARLRRQRAPARAA